MTSSPVEQIKSRLGVVEVVSGYVKLEKAGINYRACCPFHNEKTPSFFVSPARGNYYCFGCHEGGDIFNFVQKIEGVEFKEALRILADRAGVKLEYDSNKGEKADEKEKLYSALKVATEFFESNLKDHDSAIDYLQKRGVSPEEQKKWRLGWAPDTWQAMVDELRRLGFDQETMIKAGLVGKSPKNGRLYDRFRGRIMFPLFNESGRVVGFSGRIFKTNDGEREEAKYINSPQTEVYDKSSLLYGYDRAKVDIRKNNKVILVEGQMDLILSHQAGLTNTVAVSGTALGQDHINRLSRLAGTLILAFDSDGAGWRAAKKAVNIALSRGLEVKLVQLPADTDPADIIKQSSGHWRTLVEESETVIDFYLNTLSEKYSDNRILAQKFRENVYPYIKALSHRTDQDHYIKQAAFRLGVSEQAVWQEVENTKIEWWEESTSEAKKEVRAKELTRKEVLVKRLLGLKWWLEGQNQELVTFLDQKVKEIEREEEFKKASESDAGIKESQIMATELAYQNSSTAELEQEIEELINAWNKESLKEELMTAMSELKKAEFKGDQSMMDKYIEKCQNITKALNN